jgi:hypothetical protein
MPPFRRIVIKVRRGEPMVITPPPEYWAYRRGFDTIVKEYE